MSDEMIKAIHRWQNQQQMLTDARLEAGEIDENERNVEYLRIANMAKKAEELRLEAIGLGDESHLADFIVVLEMRVAYLEDMLRQVIKREYGPFYEQHNFTPPESRPFWLFLQ